MGERSSMEKFTHDELMTMATEVYDEFENQIPENERETNMTLPIANIAVSVMVKFIEKLQEKN